MGSRAAMSERSGSRGRYHQQDDGKGKHTNEVLTLQQKEKVVPEGVEGLVEWRGSVERVMHELLGGIRSGLAHTGAANVNQFREKARFWQQSVAGINEGEPHSIVDIRN